MIILVILRIMTEAAPLVGTVIARRQPVGALATLEQLRTLTDEWLDNRRLSNHTRRAYRSDVGTYLAWCDDRGLDPLAVRFTHVNSYARHLERAPTGDGRTLSATSVARKLSAVSSWYTYLVRLGLVEANPAKDIDRPHVDPDVSPTIGLTAEQVALFMRTARSIASRRDTAVLALLAELGLRVGEALALEVSDLRYNRGHRTARVTGKGAKPRELAVPVPLGRDLDVYLAERAATAGVPLEALRGPLFLTATGRRLDQPAVFRLVQRIAKRAGLPEADRLSPHSLRHTWATEALAVAPLRDVQDAMGHRDPRTTRRYDRARGSLDRSPSYLLAHIFAHDGEE